MAEAYTALWWIPRGTAPTMLEAEHRVRHPRLRGPTSHSFTLRVHFPPPGGADTEARPGRAGWMCPA
jgi:hypothetical protein